MVDVARGYSWPPAEVGNTLAETHGARSERRVGPLARAIEVEARAGSNWPGYLGDPVYSAAVTAWARAEAVCELLWRWLEEQDPADLLVESRSEESEETRERGRSRRVSTSRRVASVLDQLNTWQARASNHRQRLGLDPLSRARLGKDVTAAQVDIATLLSDLRERAEAQAVSGAVERAVGGGTDTSAGDGPGVPG